MEAGSASITTSFGSVEARNIHGDLMVHDNNGNIDVSNVGGAADITDSFGNVAFSQVKGRVNCTTSNGRVNGSSLFGNARHHSRFLRRARAEQYHRNAQCGNLQRKDHAALCHGIVELKSSFGAIEASDIAQGIRAITGNGSITLTDIGGDTFAKTSFAAFRRSHQRQSHRGKYQWLDHRAQREGRCASDHFFRWCNARVRRRQNYRE